MASNFDENYVQLLKPENETIQKPFRLNGPYKSISFDDLLSGDTRSYEVSSKIVIQRINQVLEKVETP